MMYKMAYMAYKAYNLKYNFNGDNFYDCTICTIMIMLMGADVWKFLYNNNENINIKKNSLFSCFYCPWIYSFTSILQTELHSGLYDHCGERHWHSRTVCLSGKIKIFF